MPGETPADLAYSHATENIAVQRQRLDNVRTRATTLITAAAVLASFLGGQALADSKRVPGVAAPLPDRSLQFWEAVGFIAFLVVLFVCAWITSPKFRRKSKPADADADERGVDPNRKPKGWRFRLNAEKMLAETRALKYANPGLDDAALGQLYKRQLVGDLECHHKMNERTIERRMKWLWVAIVALALEAVGFGLDLVT